MSRAKRLSLNPTLSANSAFCVVRRSTQRSRGGAFSRERERVRVRGMRARDGKQTGRMARLSSLVNLGAAVRGGCYASSLCDYRCRYLLHYRT